MWLWTSHRSRVGQMDPLYMKPGWDGRRQQRRAQPRGFSRAAGPFVTGVGARGSAWATDSLCSPGSLQEASALPTHMAPELTLEAFGSREVPAQGDGTSLLLTNVKLFIHLPPHGSCTVHHPYKAKLEVVVNSPVKAERAEGRLCPQGSCRHHLADWHHDWCQCFLKHLSQYYLLNISFLLWWQTIWSVKWVLLCPE